MTAAGPYDRWPLGRGFERYYGFLGGDTNQYYPELVRDNSQTEPEKTPEEGYHLTPDLVEKAKAMIADAKAGRAEQAVLHVLRARRDALAASRPQRVGRRVQRQVRRRLGRVPQAGLREAKEARHRPGERDALAPRSRRQVWETLPADERRVYARMMEVFAGFLTHTDHYIGDLIAFLKEDRRIRQHADHADLRQRLERRRRPARLGQRVPLLQQRRRHASRRISRDRRHRRPEDVQPLSVGLDLSPATRRSGAGSARRTAAA